MSENKKTKEFFNDLPEDIEIFVNKSIEISDRIESILKNKNITQRTFASLLGKEESEISKWLSGTHNFTLKTLAKIEKVLGEEIINIKQEIKTLTISNNEEENNYHINWKLKNFTAYFNNRKKSLPVSNRTFTISSYDSINANLLDFTEFTTIN